MTQVTGILTDEVGTILANTTCAVVAIDPIVGQDGGGRVSRGSIVVTDGAGEFDADIKPGQYELVVEVSAPADANVKFSRIGRLTVLTTGPMTLEEALDTSFGPINPSILQQAIEAKDAAEAAAVLAQSAYQGRQYETRAEFVADTDYAPDDGTVVTAGGLSYARSAGATALPGLPGWLPFGPAVDIRHMGAVEGQNCADALKAADEYAVANQLSTYAEGRFVIEKFVELNCGFSDYSRAVFHIAPNFPDLIAVRYEQETNNLESFKNIAINFEGDRDNQDHEVVAFLLNRSPSGRGKIYVSGFRCNTLFALGNNAERTRAEIQHGQCNLVILDDSSGTGSPDTNHLSTSGGQSKQLYLRNGSTTTILDINEQSQDETAGVPYLDVTNGRSLRVSGEMRGLQHTFMRINQPSADASWTTHLDVTVICATAQAAVPVLDVPEAGSVSGSLITSNPNGPAAHIERLRGGLLDIQVLSNRNVAWSALILGSATASSSNATINLTFVGGSAPTNVMEIWRANSSQINYYGSILPVSLRFPDNTASRNCSVSLPRDYIANNVSVSVDGSGNQVDITFRGQHLSGNLNSYTTKVRGMQAKTLNGNHIAVCDGTNWLIPTTTVL